jgi:DNA-binding transcriptional ArsR family regulator
VSADPACRAIARALAHDRLRAGDLGRLLPGISHGTLLRRLRYCAALGLLNTEKEGRSAWLSLSDAARWLASLALSAACWEWMFDDRDKGLLASDLAGLIYQLAPLARVPADVNGIVKLHEDWPTTLQSNIYLAVGGGRLTPFVVGPLGPWDTVASGTPQQWSEALVNGHSTGITSAGDRALLDAVIASLNPELRVDV